MGTIIGQPFFCRPAVTQRCQTGGDGQHVLPALLVVGIGTGEVEAEGGYGSQLIGQEMHCLIIHNTTGLTHPS